MRQFISPDKSAMDWNSMVSGGVGIGTALSTTVLGGKLFWDWLQRSRDEKPRYLVAQDERDAADKRADDLWTRNQMLEEIIKGMNKSHAQEREDLYLKIEDLTKSLAAARREIAELSERVEGIANAQKDN